MFVKFPPYLKLYCKQCNRQGRFALIKRDYVSQHDWVSCNQKVSVETVLITYSVSGYKDGELVVPEHVRST